MNIERRISISRLAFFVVRVRGRTLLLTLEALKIVGEPMIAVAGWIRRERSVALKNQVKSFIARATSFRAEYEAFRNGSFQHLETRQKCFLATRSALLAESEHIQTALVELRSPLAIGGPLIYVAESLRDRLLNVQGKMQAFLRLISDIKTSPNFYWDLLFWLVLPGDRVEDQIGDLNEEYTLKKAADGEARANAWYRRQVRSSIMARLWAKIERLVAIGTLIDFAHRWFKR